MRKAQQTSARTASLNGMEEEKWQVFPEHVSLSYQARRELLERVAPVYQTASLAKKTLILNDFVKKNSWAGRRITWLDFRESKSTWADSYHEPLCVMV